MSFNEVSRLPIGGRDASVYNIDLCHGDHLKNGISEFLCALQNAVSRLRFPSKLFGILAGRSINKCVYGKRAEELL